MALAYKMIRLYVQESLDTGVEVTLSEKQAHYIKHVMRLEVGKELFLFNGVDGEYCAEIRRWHKKNAVLEVKAQKSPYHSSPEVHLIFCPIKSDRLELMIEKATELGVSHFHPVISDRTIVKRINYEKHTKHIINASQQCERLDIPIMNEITPMESIVNKWNNSLPVYYGNESGAGLPWHYLQQSSVKYSTPKEWAIMVGPEGGFSKREFLWMQDRQNFHGISLGPRILRAETAAMTLAALTISVWGDWQKLPNFQSNLENYNNKNLTKPAERE